VGHANCGGVAQEVFEIAVEPGGIETADLLNAILVDNPSSTFPPLPPV
jgi:hypothetical protein